MLLLIRPTTFFLETSDVLIQYSIMANGHFCEILVFWNSVVKPGRESTSKLQGCDYVHKNLSYTSAESGHVSYNAKVVIMITKVELNNQLNPSECP